MEESIVKILQEIGENPNRDGLVKTPSRLKKAYHFLTSGYKANIEEVVGDAIFSENVEEMVLVKDIEFYSLCEHHILPFYGSLSIAYLPNKKIIGLSKISRIVDIFSRRLQVQERMTQEIANSINDILSPLGVAVFCEAKHFCMMMRGVEKQNSSLNTFSFLGDFTNKDKKNEFLNLLK